MGGTITSGDNTLYFLTEDGTAANTHYLYLNTASYGINTVSGKTYNLTFKVKSSNRNISVRALSGFAGGYTTFNIQSNSIIETAAEGANATITDMGGGVYQCSVDLTANANVADAWVIFYLYNGNRIYTGDTVSGAYIGRPQFRISTADSTYIATTSAAAIAGINGSRHLFFDGVDDHLLSNSVATLLAGSDKPFSLIMFSKSSEASATLRNAWGFAQNAGSAYMRYDLDNSLNVARRRDDAATSASANGGVHDTSGNVWSVVFTGTAISIYKNGSAVINSGSLNVGSNAIAGQ